MGLDHRHGVQPRRLESVKKAYRFLQRWDTGGFGNNVVQRVQVTVR